MLVFLCLLHISTYFAIHCIGGCMREDLMERCKVLGTFIFENNATIRQAARRFSYSKSTVHIDVSRRLKEIDVELFERARKVLENNFEEKHLRGGMATKNKYKNMKKNI